MIRRPSTRAQKDLALAGLATAIVITAGYMSGFFDWIHDTYLDSMGLHELDMLFPAFLATILATIWYARRRNNDLREDITRQLRLETELRASEAKFKSLVTNIPGMAYRMLPDSTTEYISGSDRVCGFSEDELRSTKSNWFHQVLLEDRDEVISLATELHLKPYSIMQCYRILSKDGSIRLVEDYQSSMFSADGTFECITGLVFDITDRMWAEKELEQSDRMMRAIFDGTMDGIVATEAGTGKVVVANQAISRMLRYSRDEMAGLCTNDIHPSDELPHILEAFKRHMNGETSLATDISMQRKNGTLFLADVNMTSVELLGQPCTLGVFRDITERKKAEDALRKAHTDLEIRVVERTAELAASLEELRRRNTELGEALEHVKQLQGLFPICMFCKRVRDDQDSWQAIESYITDHSEAEFSHSICQECFDKHYPEPSPSQPE